MKPIELTPAELKQHLAGPQPPTLLDVRLEDDFTEQRLPGAKHNCVFAVGFMDRMAAVAPDKHAPLCIYGAGADSLESRIATDKLCRAGYTHVLEICAGLEGWNAAGFPMEGSAPGQSISAPAIPDGVHDLDLAESRVEWTGRNLLNKHHGHIAIKDGGLRFSDGQLTGGEIVLDMRSITCENLKGTPLHDVLVAHLKSDDFFDVDLYPEARFTVTAAAPLAEARPGALNLSVNGTLTLKNVTDALQFTASAGFTAEGQPAAQAVIAFDRTKWNVLYGSGRLFRRLAGHLVNDLIELQVRLVAK